MDLTMEELFGRRESAEREVRNSDDDDDDDGQRSDDGGSEGDNPMFGADEAVEVPENQGPERKVVAPTRKVVKNPIPKLDIPRLLGPRGIGILEKTFRDVKFQGKGHEIDDLNLLLKKLQHWAHRLFPKLTFDDSLKQMEKLGSRKQLQNHIRRIRLDMFVVSEEKPENEEEEDKVLRGNEPEEDVFDELLRQNAQNMAHTTVVSSTSGQSLTAEQRARLEQSRARAEVLLRARQLRAEATAQRDLEDELFGPPREKEDAEHEELLRLQDEMEEEWEAKSQGTQKITAARKRANSDAREKGDDEEEEEDDITSGRVNKRMRRISSSSSEDDQLHIDLPRTFDEGRTSPKAVDEENGPSRGNVEDGGEPLPSTSKKSGSLQIVTNRVGSPRTFAREEEEPSSQMISAKESETREPVNVENGSSPNTICEETEALRLHLESEESAVTLPGVHLEATGDRTLDKEEGREGTVGSITKGKDEGQEAVRDGTPECLEEEMLALIND
ncbi:uncharacterized protein LOC143031712 [Oratosquilla oratoria]|uniref:uncharacterized protein LOC143031712 n=1 Tax=Oratosquilla oratoria TaxID=337810 RepID=UPI003F772697